MCLVGPPGSELECAAAGNDLYFIAEAFVDRAYRADGRLVPRRERGAVYDDVERMVAQALTLATNNEVETSAGTILAVRVGTLCVHGDTPGAVDAARAIRAALETAGIAIRNSRNGRPA